MNKNNEVLSLDEEAALDARRRQRLRKMKSIAAAFLVAAVALYALAEIMLPSHPAWGYVSAFAEAAMIGAIADWFAVVALFRHPMGVPLWHTAIIPNSKTEIADNLGQFIVTHFVTVDKIVARVRDYDPARKLAGWLQQESSGPKLGASLAQAAVTVLQSLDDTRMRAMVRDTVLRRLHAVDVSDVAGGVIDTLVQQRRHQQLFDVALLLLQEKLVVEENREKVAKFLGDALDLNSNRVLGITLRTIIDSVTPRMIDTFLRKSDEALDDPDHAWRLRLDVYAIDLVVHLKNDPKWHENIAHARDALLANEQLHEYLEKLWDDTKERLLADLQRPESALAQQLDGFALQLGQRLDKDAGLQEWVNGLILREVAPLVEQHRGGVAQFITRQIDAWSKEEMTNRVELAIGRDLQFIRINGTLVGGLVGLLIYAVTQLIKG